MTDEQLDPLELARQMLNRPADTRMVAEHVAWDQRGKFIAAVWVMGASWSQLGTLYGIRRESALSIASRFMGPDARAKWQRRARVSGEQIEEWYARWRTLCESKPEIVKTVSPLALVPLLLNDPSHTNSNE